MRSIVVHLCYASVLLGACVLGEEDPKPRRLLEEGSHCTEHSACATGLCVTTVCRREKLPFMGRCNTNDDCQNGLCVEPYGWDGAVCSRACSSDDECEGEKCVQGFCHERCLASSSGHYACFDGQQYFCDQVEVQEAECVSCGCPGGKFCNTSKCIPEEVILTVSESIDRNSIRLLDGGYIYYSTTRPAGPYTSKVDHLVMRARYGQAAETVAVSEKPIDAAWVDSQALYVIECSLPSGDYCQAYQISRVPFGTVTPQFFLKGSGNWVPWLIAQSETYLWTEVSDLEFKRSYINRWSKPGGTQVFAGEAPGFVDGVWLEGGELRVVLDASGVVPREYRASSGSAGMMLEREYPEYCHGFERYPAINGWLAQCSIDLVSFDSSGKLEKLGKAWESIWHHWMLNGVLYWDEEWRPKPYAYYAFNPATRERFKLPLDELMKDEQGDLLGLDHDYAYVWRSYSPMQFIRIPLSAFVPMASQ